MEEVSTKAPTEVEKPIVLATAQGTQDGTATAELVRMPAAAKRGRPQRPPQLGQCVKLMPTMMLQVLHTHFMGAWREPLPLEGRLVLPPLPLKEAAGGSVETLPPLCALEMRAAMSP